MRVDGIHGGINHERPRSDTHHTTIGLTSPICYTTYRIERHGPEGRPPEPNADISSREEEEEKRERQEGANEERGRGVMILGAGWDMSGEELLEFLQQLLQP
jgi:Ser-tRNA(Ala) deacylase AlaX